MKEPEAVGQANWTKAQKYNLTTALSDFTSVQTYDHTGAVDYSYLFDEYNAASDKVSEIGSNILKDNLQDMNIRQAMALGGWKPKVDDMAAQAVDWLRGGWSTSPMTRCPDPVTDRSRRGKCLPGGGELLRLQYLGWGLYLWPIWA